MIAELPFEIWTQVSYHLSAAQLDRLCGVNTAFFESAMVRKYGEAKMGGIVDENVFLALANPAVSRKVQSLVVDTLNFKTYLLLDPESFSSKLTLPVAPAGKKFKDILSLPNGYSKNDSVGSLDATRFTSLQSLSITISSIYHYVTFLSKAHLLRAVGRLWTSMAFSPTLTSLTLKVPIEVYHDALVPSSLHIPSLTSLTLHIWSGYRTTDYTTLLQMHLAPLVNRHAPSLRHLAVEVQESFFRVVPYYYSSQSLFKSIGHLERLEAVSVKEPLLSPSQTDLSALNEFLRRHSGQVKDLTLHLRHSLYHQCPHDRRGSPINRFSDSHLKTALPFLFAGESEADVEEATTPPNLPAVRVLNFAVFGDDADHRPLDLPTALSIEPPPSSFPLDLFLEWVRGRPLEALHLPENLLSPAAILQIVSSPHFSESLRDLSLSLASLRPNLLRQLEKALPRLDTLVLSIWRFEPDRIDPIERNGRDASMTASDGQQEEQSVGAQLRRYIFADWALRKLTITVSGLANHVDAKRSVFEEVFPNVKQLDYKMLAIQMRSII